MGSMPPTSSASYMVARASRPLPAAPPPGNTPVCSSDDDQDASTVEDQGEDLCSIWEVEGSASIIQDDISHC